MNMNKTPRPGDIFYLAKDKPYQIITLGVHKETCESMVIYQALYGDYDTYVLPLSKFLDEIKGEAIIEKRHKDTDERKTDNKTEETNHTTENHDASQGKVSEVLISFLDADSYSQKLEVLTSNMRAIDDKMINDMAVSLDCTVEDGPIDQRLQALIYCLKQLSRFEVRRR